MAKKKIEWLTIAEIKRAAKKTRIAAVECSVEHWRQLVAASRKELIWAHAHDLVGVDEKHCALCVRHIRQNWLGEYQDCGTCPVASHYEEACNGLFAYRKAAEEFEEIVSGSSMAFPRWHRAAKKVLAQLEEIAGELQAKKKRKQQTTPKIRSKS